MFKKIILSLGIITTTTLFGFEYKIEPQKITDNVWCFLGETAPPTKENGGYMSNSCYIKTDKSYVLLDTGSSYKFAKKTYEEMSKIAKLPVSDIIVTHVHDDHWLGNGYFKEKFNSKVYGPSLINSQHSHGSKTRMFNILPEDVMHGTEVVEVDVVVEEETVLNIGGKTIEIIPMGFTAHTEEDIVVFLKDEKVFFAGDIVMNGRITSTRDGNLLGLMKALNKIDTMDWEYLVPGHGHDTSKTAADQIKLYTKLLKQRVLAAIEDGVESDTISDVVTLEEFKDVNMYEIFNRRNVFDAFAELEFYDGE